MDRIGRYEIVSELGRGAMGIVYRAHDPRIGRDVAIKTIKLADQAGPDETQGLRDRLFREAQSAGRLSHPGIVTIYDIAEENGIAYISMEFVEGRTLEGMIDSGEVGDLGTVAQLIEQMAGALDYAHAREIVHRDIKPANILVTHEGEMKITDFGIARIASSKMTQTGIVMGTPSYMSPEQVRGESIDGRSDQFSLTVIAYELITGCKPFTGDSLTSVIFKIVSEEPKTPCSINADLSEDLDEAVLKGLAKRPGERFPNCRDFAAQFTGCLVGGETKATTGGAPLRTGRQPPPHTVVSALDETAPVSAVSPAQGIEEQETVFAQPAESPKLPPLSSRGRDRGAGVSHGEVQPAPKKRSRTVLVALLAGILGVVVAAIAMNPWLLDDPAGMLGFVDTGILGSNETSDGEGDDGPAGSGQTTAGVLPPPSLDTTPDPVVDPDPPATDEPADGSEAAGTVEPTPAPPPTPAKRAPPRPAVARASVVSFSGQPRGAKVVVDQEPAWTCTQPCYLELPVGDHVALVTFDGFFPHRRSFEVGSDASTVAFELEEIVGTLKVSSAPPGATIYVDGKKRQETTPATFRLKPGTHVVRVQGSGMPSSERTVEMEANTLRSIRFSSGN